MPYVIEMYAPSKSTSEMNFHGLAIAKDFLTKEAALAYIPTLESEQKRDNEELMKMALEIHTEKLRNSVLDLDTDDRIVPLQIRVTQYNYSFKVNKISLKMFKHLCN